MELSAEHLAIAIRRLDGAEKAQQSVLMYSPYEIDVVPGIAPGANRWSIQQRLILK